MGRDTLDDCPGWSWPWQDRIAVDRFTFTVDPSLILLYPSLSNLVSMCGPCARADQTAVVDNGSTYSICVIRADHNPTVLVPEAENGDYFPEDWQ